MDLRSRNKVNPAFNMSSMTDLVFLLLIFFIIVSTLVSPYGLGIDLPEGKSQSKENPVVTLTITSDLEYMVNDVPVMEERIADELRKVLGDKKVIKLAVDKTVPTGETVKTLGMAKQNGWDMVIATNPDSK